MPAVKERAAPAYTSGFCGLRNPATSHARCPGGYGDLTCSCTCRSACGQKLPAVQS